MSAVVAGVFGREGVVPGGAAAVVAGVSGGESVAPSLVVSRVASWAKRWTKFGMPSGALASAEWVSSFVVLKAMSLSSFRIMATGSRIAGAALRRPRRLN